MYPGDNSKFCDSFFHSVKRLFLLFGVQYHNIYFQLYKKNEFQDRRMWDSKREQGILHIFVSVKSKSTLERSAIAVPKCLKSFAQLSTFGRHMKVYTGEKPSTCLKSLESCAKSFHLKTHYMRTHTKMKRHSCFQCTKSFFLLCHLTQHLTIHPKDKYGTILQPFLCLDEPEICIKSYIFCLLCAVYLFWQKLFLKTSH